MSWYFLGRPKLQADEEDVRCRRGRRRACGSACGSRRTHRRHGQDLILGSQTRVFPAGSHDLDLVAAGQVLLAGRAADSRSPAGTWATGRSRTGADPTSAGPRSGSRSRYLPCEAGSSLLTVARGGIGPAPASPSLSGPSRCRPPGGASRRSIRSISARSASSWSCTATRWALALHDAAAQLTRRRPGQILGLPRLPRRRSLACCASRAEPASTPAAPTYTSISSTPVAGEHELPDLIRMGRAPRLQHEQQPVAFTVGPRRCVAAARCPPSTTRFSALSIVPVNQAP